MVKKCVYFYEVRRNLVPSEQKIEDSHIYLRKRQKIVNSYPLRKGYILSSTKQMINPKI